MKLLLLTTITTTALCVVISCPLPSGCFWNGTLPTINRNEAKGALIPRLLDWAGINKDVDPHWSSPCKCEAGQAKVHRQQVAEQHYG